MNILQEITQRNRVSLQERKSKIPFATLSLRAEELPAPQSFTDVFNSPGIHVIAELKSASPSKGVIRESLQIPQLARSLEASGATALSVLTEPFFFSGSLHNLELASQSCTLPLLRKDFIFDPYQVAEAKLCGASAILLIAAMLSMEEFRALSEYAHRLGLKVLGEAHTEQELEIVQTADLIGINARNLRDFSTSLTGSAALIAKADLGKPVIAESAVKTAEDIRFLQAAGAKGFLIGETLMRAPSPAEKLKELLSCF